MRFPTVLRLVPWKLFEEGCIRGSRRGAPFLSLFHILCKLGADIFDLHFPCEKTFNGSSVIRQNVRLSMRFPTVPRLVPWKLFEEGCIRSSRRGVPFLYMFHILLNLGADIFDLQFSLLKNLQWVKCNTSKCSSGHALSNGTKTGSLKIVWRGLYKRF